MRVQVPLQLFITLVTLSHTLSHPLSHAHAFTHTLSHAHITHTITHTHTVTYTHTHTISHYSTPSQEHDSYSAFRSQRLNLEWSLNVQPQRPEVSVCLVKHTLPRTETQLWWNSGWLCMQLCEGIYPFWLHSSLAVLWFGSNWLSI